MIPFNVVHQGINGDKGRYLDDKTIYLPFSNLDILKENSLISLPLQFYVAAICGQLQGVSVY